jgi:hypothetical protein
MQRIILFWILISLYYLSYSQDTGHEPDVTISDFESSNFDMPTILLYRVNITFPYKANFGTSGAYDKFFWVKTETFIRLALNKTNTSYCIVPNTGNSDQDIKLNSIRYYSYEHYSILQKKFKLSDASLTLKDSGYSLSFKPFIDSIAIIDINLTSTSKSKDYISFKLDNNLIYRDFRLDIRIPEIYFYDIGIKDPCLVLKERKSSTGPVIGYFQPGQGGLVSSDYKSWVVNQDYIIWDVDYNFTFLPAYCLLNTIRIEKADPCQNLRSTTVEEILEFKLDSIHEITSNMYQ